MDLEKYKEMNTVERVAYTHGPTIGGYPYSRAEVLKYLDELDAHYKVKAVYTAAAEKWNAREDIVFSVFKEDLFNFHSITGNPRAEELWKLSLEQAKENHYSGPHPYEFIVKNFEALVRIIK
jgi:hypothetical protein